MSEVVTPSYWNLSAVKIKVKIKHSPGVKQNEIKNSKREKQNKKKTNKVTSLKDLPITRD
jgi:hypothetical protein